MGTRFRTMLAPIGTSTGDGRRFREGALTLAPTPFPFEWARERDIGHDGAVVVGAVQEADIDTVAKAVQAGWISEEAVKDLDRDMQGIWARGELFDDVDREEMPRLAEDVAESMRLIEEGVLGPSVDLDSFEGVPVREGTDDEITEEDLDDPDLRVELLITEGRTRAATLVSIPAFVETVRPMEMMPDDQDQEPDEDDDEMAALVASVIGSTGLPIADTGRAWDGTGAAGRVFEANSNADGEVNVAGVSRAFLWRDPDADPQTKGAYKLGFADVIDGTLTIVPRGVAAAAGGRGVDAADIPAADKDRIKAKICSIYGKIQAANEDWPDCPFDRDSESSTRALVASVAAPTLPAARVFDIPEPDVLTPVTYDYERGLVYGHVAEWESCHTGFADVCVIPPRSPREDGDYPWFHRFPVDTDGGLVWAGRLTVGGRHVGLTADAGATMTAHDAKTTAAYVRARDGKLGLWISGPLVASLDDPEDPVRRVLDRRKISGDWRETADGLSLVELLALSPGPRLHSEPGFPVAVGMRSGRQVALTASLGPSPETESQNGLKINYDLIAAMVVGAMRTEQTRERERAELAQAMEVTLGPVRERARAELAELLEGAG